MPRIITSVSFDLKFNVLDTPPQVVATFTDQDDVGRETHGRTTFVDAEAAALWGAVQNGEGLLGPVNAAIDAQAAGVKEPGSVAARIEAADKARREQALAVAAKDAAAAETAALDAQIVAKRTEKATADAAHAAALQAARAIEEETVAKRAALAALELELEAKRAPKEAAP